MILPTIDISEPIAEIVFEGPSLVAVGAMAELSSGCLPPSPTDVPFANIRHSLWHIPSQQGSGLTTIRQAKLRETNAERIGKLERNYQEYTIELRRRYFWHKESTAHHTI